MGLISLCLTVSALSLSACAGAVIPDSLKAPCESTVGDLSTARTAGDLGQAIVRGDGDLRVCNIKKDAVVAIAESANRPWWRFW
jgi:hypothetical protein